MHDRHSLQMQGDGQSQSLAQSQPDYVTATATFLGLVYPGRGLEQTVRKEHMDNMTAADYMKVWKVRRKASHLISVLISVIVYMLALICLHSCSLKHSTSAMQDYVSKLTHLLLALDSNDSIQAHQQVGSLGDRCIIHIRSRASP